MHKIEENKNVLGSDYIHLCRLCASRSNTCREIFNFSRENIQQIVDSIKLCLDICVSDTDELPTSVCDSCFKNLKIFHHFKLNCIKAQAELLQIFQCFDRDVSREGLVKVEFEEVKSEDGYDFLDHDDESFDTGVNEEEFGFSKGETKKVKSKSKIRTNLAINTVREGKKVFDLTGLPPLDIDIETAAKEISRSKFDCEDFANTSDHSDLSVHKIDNIHFSNDFKILVLSYARDSSDYMTSKKFKISESRVSRWKEKETDFLKLYRYKDILEERLCQKLTQKKDESKSYKKMGRQLDGQPGKIKSGFTLDLVEKILERKFKDDEEKNKFVELINEAKDEDILVESLKVDGPEVTFDSKVQKISEHLYSLKFVRKWRCTICQESLYCSGFGYEEHVKSKHGEELPRYKCEICSHLVISTKFESYCSHLKTHVNDFNCERCGRRFGKKATLTNHLKTCGVEERPFVCPICGKSFKTDLGVNQHVKITHMESGDVIKCEHCGKTYKTKQSYEKHYHAEHEGFRIPCDICGNKFKCKAHLMAHKRTVHSDERPYPCTQCSYATKTSQSLHSHMQRLHNKPKHHQCAECDKKFCTPGELKKHENSHTSIPGFHCDQCGKGFKSGLALKEHGYSHTGEYPHKCEYCERQYRSSANYYTHRKNCQASFLQQKELFIN